MYTNVTNRSRIWLVAIIALLFCLPGAVRAQGNFTPSELDTLVANIALYPDPLLVQVLAASTYGDQIHPASVWADAHKNLTGKDLSEALERAKLPYDVSVQALIPFPQVLSMMDRYPAWTEQLGDAVFMQKEEVMAAVQRLRRTASKFGHLRSDDRVKVSSGENITITPVRTEYVYVPVYNPYYVYYRYYDGYARISYAPGIWIGGWFGYWGWGSCWFDWNTRIIYVRDTYWYPPRRHIPRHHRYAPPPRHHNDRPHRHVAPPPPRHDVGPKLGHNPPPARSQASSRPRDDRHEARLPDRGFENRDGRRSASPTVWDEPRDHKAKAVSQPASRPAPQSRSSSPSGFRSPYEDEGSQSTSRSRNDNSRDDRDSRSDRSSSRGGAGRVIQRR